MESDPLNTVEYQRFLAATAKDCRAKHRPCPACCAGGCCDNDAEEEEDMGELYYREDDGDDD